MPILRNFNPLSADNNNRRGKGEGVKMKSLRVLFSIIAILAAVGATAACFTNSGKALLVAEETSADDTAGGDDYEYTEFA